ncbi:MAG: hypothetical protein AAF570_23805, partial [Bacteroidota bacterium]
LKQEMYSETGLKEAAASYRWARQLATTKYQFYQWLLRQLRHFHEGNSLTASIRDRLNEIELLFGRGLHAQATTILNKVYPVARDHEKFHQVIDILSLKLELVDHGILEWEEGPVLQAEINAVMQSLEALSRMQARFRTLRRTVMRLGFIRSDAQLQKLQEGFDRSQMEEGYMPLSNREAIFFHRSWALYYRSAAEFRGLIRHSRAITELLEAHPGLLEEQISIYAESITLQLYGVCWFFEVEKVNPLMEKLKKVAEGYPEMGSLHLHNYHHMRLNILLYFGEFEAAGKWADYVQTLLPSYQKALPPTFFAHFYFNVAHAEFGRGNYTACANFLDQLITNAIGPIPVNLYSMTRICYLVALYESGNELILPYAIRSCFRALAKREIIFDLERILLGFLRKVLREPDPNQLIPLFTDLHQQLMALNAFPRERIALEAFNLTAWLYSRIHGLQACRYNHRLNRIVIE